MDEPTAVYRLFDEDDVLLYVGVTGRPSMRFSQHKATKAWWPDVARKDVAWMGSREEALVAEENAIHQEGPLWNVSKPVPRMPTERGTAVRKVPPPLPAAEDPAQPLGKREALQAAAQRRDYWAHEAAEARAEIERLVVELFKLNPSRSREEVAEIAELSPVSVRAIAKAHGIPRLKPGGVGRRVTKSP